MMKKFLVVFVCFGMLLFVGIPRADAAGVALDFSDTDSWSFAAGLTVGWGFTVNNEIIVTDLGYYDARQPGLTFDHGVGLFRVSDMSLITSGTVTTSDPITGLFRYTAVAPVTLDPGVTYYVAGYDPPFTAWPYDAIGIPEISDLVWAPEITFEGWQSESSPSLQFTFYAPSTDPWANSNGYMITSNFKFSPVPIPGAVWLFGSGFLGLIGIKRKFGR